MNVWPIWSPHRVVWISHQSAELSIIRFTAYNYLSRSVKQMAAQRANQSLWCSCEHKKSFRMDITSRKDFSFCTHDFLVAAKLKYFPNFFFFFHQYVISLKQWHQGTYNHSRAGARHIQVLCSSPRVEAQDHQQQGHSHWALWTLTIISATHRIKRNPQSYWKPDAVQEK